MGLYFDEMKRSMEMLALHPKSVFLYQDYGRVSWTLKDVPAEKKIDLPVIEEAQMGFCTGLSLAGYLPISCYVRWNFLLCAANQLVNHLDKLELMSRGGYKPKVIIRTAVGSTTPLYPGIQSVGDYATAFRLMFNTIEVVSLREPEDIYPAYCKALRAEESTLLVEYGDYHENK